MFGVFAVLAAVGCVASYRAGRGRVQLAAIYSWLSSSRRTPVTPATPAMVVGACRIP